MTSAGFFMSPIPFKHSSKKNKCQRKTIKILEMVCAKTVGGAPRGDLSLVKASAGDHPARERGHVWILLR
jgi:hypothetical protein